MSQTLLEMAKELVLAQIQGQQIAPENMQSSLQSTHATLQHLQAAETSGGSNGAGERLEAAASVDWKGSVTKHSVKCLECGEMFKQLSLRHLRLHDLDPRTYRQKYGIPRTQALSAKEVTARRRELAQQIRPWELAPSKQPAAAKETMKPAVKNGAAKPAAKAAAKKTAPGAADKKAAAKA